jgi:ecotin
MKTFWPACALVLLAALVAVRAEDNLKAFPAAEPGMVRHVLQLPKLDDESAAKVELIVGMTAPVDEENRYFFTGKLVAETIQGWGFQRYVLDRLGSMAGTMMAVDPNKPKVNRFIALGGEPYLVRYNSRLPIVVYAPDGVEVRYRIWSASAETKPIEKG